MKAGFLVVALLAVACSRATRVSSRVSPADEPATTAKVVNDGIVDMDVYVTSAGQRYHLGRVGGGHTEVFTIPRAIVHYSTTLGFEIRPLAGGTRSRTESMTMSPGDQVTLMIPPD